MQAVLQLLLKLTGQLRHKSPCFWLGHDDIKLSQPGAPNLYYNWRCCKRCGRSTGDLCGLS
jgi:hypothetical protein